MKTPLIALLLLGLTHHAAANHLCSTGVAVQVLGSGGPIADDARASSGYLLWQQGRSRLLVDVGGGVFLRFGEAGARIEDLDLIAATHLHTDHISDLPALLKSGYFSERRRVLPISGPSGSKRFPSITEFVHGLFDETTGNYRYLAGFLDGSDGLFMIEPIQIDADRRRGQTLLHREGLRVDAIGVHHGIVPALAYRAWIGEKSVVFSGDLSARNEAFVDFAKGADLLIMDHAIPEQAGPGVRSLHIIPSDIGRMAAQARVGKLLLSHRMARSLGHEAQTRAAIGKHYTGPVAFAEDLACLPIGGA